jgi:hypothetical protein
MVNILTRTTNSEAQMSSCANNWLGIFLLSLGLLYACSAKTNPQSEHQFTLEYLGTSDDDRVFQLKNWTADTVSFRGANGFVYARPLQGVTHLECQAAGRDGWLADARIAEAGPEAIKLNPGKARKLKIEGAFTRDFSGGKCRLRLTLLDGRSIESNSFSP